MLRKVSSMMALFLAMGISLKLQAQSVLYAGKQSPAVLNSSTTNPTAYIYLPWDYYITAKNYPLIIFASGTGQYGSGGSQLPILLGDGLPEVINQGHPPYSVNRQTGDTTWFIVISPQAPGIPGLFPSDFAAWENAAVKFYHLRVDIGKVFLTGLSQGGDNILGAYYTNVDAGGTILPYRTTAMVSMSPAHTIPNNKLNDFSNVRIWFFQGDNDGTVGQTGTENYNMLAPLFPNNGYKLTQYPGGHCCWVTYYQPTWNDSMTTRNFPRTDSISIYDYLLGYSAKGSVNAPPVSKPGNAQTITLPLDSVLLDGSTSYDPDGKIVSYQWTEKSGPAAFAIASAGNAKTEVTGLVAGSYIFTLSVKDDSGAVSSADVSITVNALPPNKPPVSEPGSTQTITLPVDSVLLDGSASYDPDGKIVSYQWTKKSGPAGYTISNAGSAKTEATGLGTGTYIFTLTVKDDSGATNSADVSVIVKDSTVTTPLNQPPVANTGSAQTITLPVDSVLLDGSASYDPDGKVVSYQWTKKSGPAGYTLSNADSARTEVTGLVAGNYVFSLTVKDDSGATATADVMITIKDSAVKSNADTTLVANAGNNQALTLPVDSAILDGSGSSDKNNTIASYSWTKVSGPATYVISNANSVKATVNISSAGTYVFRLTIVNSIGDSASSNVTITVNGVLNRPPVANAGNAQAITLPVDSVLLDGSASYDPDGKIVSYQWTKKSGTGGFTIVHPDSVKTIVTGLDTGNYVFMLTVTDDSGATASADVSITVNKAKILGTPDHPIADAGNDTTITMPVNSVYLDGSRTAGENVSGFIVFSWSKISGPQQSNIVFPGKPVTEVQNLTVGTYYFQLTIQINGGAKASDTVKVVVLPDPVQPGNVGYTANTLVPVYNGMFRYGTNMGAFSGWTDTGVAGVALQAGAHSLRLPLPDYFVGHYGYDVRLSAFDYYMRQLGMKELTLFVGEPRPAYDDDSVYAPATQPSLVFKNLYKPIWDNGENGTPVNDSNYFAVYIYNLVQRYGKNIKFWEIINEPDITGFWDNGNVTRSDSWWNSPPSSLALLNVRAPIFYYIRMLRVAYEVIKKYYPDEYICPGGIGYPAFLDALLRYTDNPDGGKVTPQYPLTGGAYFDAVSFHDYPAYSLSAWDGSINGFKWSRYSDRAANAIFDLKEEFDSVLNNRGYNGIKYPKKDFIITESNIPSKTFGSYFGSVDAQRNFIIKALVKSQEKDVKQFYIYIISNTTSSSNPGPYDYMGLYQNMDQTTYGGQKFTDEGMAFKTTSQLLYGWTYDSIRTKELNLPDSVDGAAFRKDTQYRYVLWAKTHIDLSEAANASYSFPAALAIDSLYQYAWNYSVDASAKSVTGSKNIQLTGAPLFFSTTPVVDSTNIPPLANAGKNQTIMLPVDSVTLDASGSTDPDGTIVSYKWTKTTGPSAFTLDTTNTVHPIVSGLDTGVYTFVLTVTDNRGAAASDSVTVTVNAKTNLYPIPNAGVDRTIILPQDSVHLDGSASMDPDGTIVKYQWSLQSGPTSYTFGSPNSANTVVTNLVPGTYIFTLTVTDNDSASASGSVTVFVNAKVNKPPVANAGSNITIQLPVDSVLLDGSKSYDPDGTITGYQWDQNSGPSTASFGPQNGSQVPAFHLTAGTYVFSLIVKDNQGASDTALVTVTVKSANNQAPVANAGANIAIQLPVDSALLNGSASYDPDGNIVSWKWAQKSGPSYTIQKDTSSQTMVTGLVQGVYVFTLTVTDNDGAASSSSVAVTVSGKDSVSPGPPPVIAPNQSPVANAGRNQVISLPADSIALDGSASYDPDGKIVSWKWVKKSGPSAAVLNNDTVATTLVSGLVAGTYVFTLTVTDNNGGTSSADVSVLVNQPPVAKAGQNQVINLPVASVTLDGSGSYDPDGKIVSWQWVEQSGPSPIVINNNGNPVINPYGLVVGTYVFTLTVTDNNGAASSANVSVRVNHPPVANAGNNVNIFLPVDSTLLDGSASNDPDGSIVSWSWTQRSGPSSANIVQAANAKTQVNSLVNGVYVFTLIVTDNDGAKDTADVTIGVYEKPSQPPVADAGKDITIVLPQNSVTLDGTASHDPDGTIVSYHWDPMTGPTQPKLHTPDASITIVSGLQMGTYDFKLTVTDNKGMSSTATVSVYVMPGRDTTPITFIIYPNPVHDELHVELNKAITGLLTFRIIDVNGRIMKQYYFGQLPMHTTKVLDVSGLAPGIYFIQLIEDNQLRDVRKMIKY